MPADAPTGQPVFRDLASPRPLSAAEQRLLSWLAAEVGPAVTAQVADAVVVGECACGCSSVSLSAAGAPPLDDPEHRAVDATGRGPHGSLVNVALHLFDGWLHELEVFDSCAGEGVAVDLEALTALELDD